MTGTRLTALLHLLNIRPCPGCNDHAETMDKNGADWCAANLETIVDWLQESAHMQGRFFWRPGGRWLVRLAIRQARSGRYDIEAADITDETPTHIAKQVLIDSERVA